MQSAKLKLTTKEIYTCVFARDGRHALTSAQGNPLGLWDLKSGDCLQTFEHIGPVWAAAWSQDQRVFLSLDGKRFRADSSN